MKEQFSESFTATNDVKEESNSITGQRELLRDYISQRPELREFAVRVDDGFSGSTFERPSFQKMIEDVKAGRTDCIIVKDLSRFGRNYLDAGEYIEKIFPFLGVRFIAVNDNYDILQADIHEMVVALIRTYAAYAVSLEHLLLLQKERIQAEKRQARRELAVLQSRRNQLEKSLQDLYEKLIDGTIDKETYLSQKTTNQAQMQELTEKMERLEKSSQTTTDQGGAFIEKYKEYTELETLTAEIANDVVKRVTVYKDGGIEIELALRDELEALLTCLETVDAAS